MDVVLLDRLPARGNDPGLGRADTQLGSLLDHHVDLLELPEQLLVVVGALVVLSDEVAVGVLEAREDLFQIPHVGQHPVVLCLHDQCLDEVGAVSHLGCELQPDGVVLVDLHQHGLEALHLVGEAGGRLLLGHLQEAAEVLHHLPRHLDVVGADGDAAALLGGHADAEGLARPQRDEVHVEHQAPVGAAGLLHLVIDGDEGALQPGPDAGGPLREVEGAVAHRLLLHLVGLHAMVHRELGHHVVRLEDVVLDAVGRQSGHGLDVHQSLHVLGGRDLHDHVVRRGYGV
mmetsp:Transcript_76227/g.236035  ORF Transcript_76227/g.236035 Transcript_76227/m.236035 type:complete len:287 (-) Transcript_76227:1249-2109(-)